MNNCLRFLSRCRRHCAQLALLLAVSMVPLAHAQPTPVPAASKTVALAPAATNTTKADKTRPLQTVAAPSLIARSPPPLATGADYNSDAAGICPVVSEVLQEICKQHPDDDSCQH